MAEIKRTLILEVREGVGTPDSIALEAGREMDPIAVGTRGDWRIEAEGLLDVHAFLFFDGTTLYAQSADRARPAIVEGRAIGDAWMEIVPPATIDLATARIVFRSLSDDFDDTTEVNPPKAPSVRPFAPGAFSRRDDEATRLEPISGHPRPARPAPRASVTVADRPRPPSHSAHDEPTRIDAPAYVPPDEQPTRLDAPAYVPPRPRMSSRPPPPVPPAPLFSAPAPIPQVPAVIVAPQTPLPPLPPPIAPPGAIAQGPIDLPPLAPAPAPATKGNAGPWLIAQWRAASAPKKILLLLLPLVVASVVVIFRDEPEPPPAKPPPRASAPSSANAPAPQIPAPAASISAPAAPAVPPAPAASSSAFSATAPDASGARLERAAIDAVAAGAYGDAIRLYDSLAAAYPDKPVYREAARILRAKVDAGGP